MKGFAANINVLLSDVKASLLVVGEKGRHCRKRQTRVALVCYYAQKPFPNKQRNKTRKVRSCIIYDNMQSNTNARGRCKSNTNVTSMIYHQVCTYPSPKTNACSGHKDKHHAEYDATLWLTVCLQPLWTQNKHCQSGRSSCFIIFNKETAPAATIQNTPQAYNSITDFNHFLYFVRELLLCTLQACCTKGGITQLSPPWG